MDTEIVIKNNKKTRSCQVYQDYDNEHASSAESLYTASSHLQDLNEYCLLGIFSNKTLTLKDLFSLAETCECFKRITQCVFPKDLEVKFTCLSDGLSRVYYFETQKESISFKLEKDIKRFLKFFGSNLRALSIKEIDETVINAVAKYCSNGSLKQIEIFSRGTIEKIAVNFKSIFQYLRTLSLCDIYMDYVIDPEISKLKCDSLIELYIYNAYCWSDILKNTFPQLELLDCVQNSYYTGKPFIFDEIFIRFLARHKRLKILSLSSYGSFPEDLAHTISSNCKELEELRFFDKKETIHFDFSKLLCLKKLRVLEIYVMQKCHNHLVVLFEGTQSLEILKMLRMDVTSDMLVSLSKLQSFRELQLEACKFEVAELAMLTRLTKLELFDIPLSNNKILDLILNLANLEELSIFNGFDINDFIEKSYDDIGRSIQLSPNRILKIKGYFKNNILENFKQNRQIKLIRWSNFIVHQQKCIE